MKKIKIEEMPWITVEKLPKLSRKGSGRIKITDNGCGIFESKHLIFYNFQIPYLITGLRRITDVKI